MTKKIIKVLHLRSSGAFLGAENVVNNISTFSKEYEVHCTIGIPLLKTKPIPEFARQATASGNAVKIFYYDRVFDPKLAKSIREFTVENEIDLIHSHGYQENFYAVLSRIKIPLVATNHLWKRTNLKLKLYARLDAFLLRHFKRIVAVSNEINDELVELGYEKKTAIIANGVDIDVFAKTTENINKEALQETLGIPSNKVVIGMVSSLTTAKAHRTAIAALKLLVESNTSNTHLVIVGDGDLRGELEELVLNSNLSKHVTFLGQRNDVRTILSCFDIYCLPSLIEGLPMSLLEAMAAGLPVVATKVGDIPLLIDDDTNGLLISPRDPSSLSSKLNILIDNEEKRRLLGRNARETIVEKFSAKEMANSYCKLYKEAISR